MPQRNANPAHARPSTPAVQSRTRRRLLTAGAAALALPAFPARAAWPERPITFICPWPAGGTADLTMRALCQAAARELKQSIVVENRAGAAGMIGAKAIAAAKPDGYTVGQIPISVTRFSQLGSVALDPLKDFTYIARTSGQTFGIAVLPTSPLQTLKDLVTRAKAAPEALTYATSGIAGATHVGMEEFSLAAGVKLRHIPFKGGADAIQALFGNHVDMLADSSSWAPHVESGKLRLLATWGETRTERFKDVPTLKDAGYDVVVDAPNGIGAPRGLDPAVTQRLRDAFRVAVASPEFKQACHHIDAPILYLDGGDYEKYVASIYQREKVLIDKLKLKELVKG